LPAAAPSRQDLRHKNEEVGVAMNLVSTSDALAADELGQLLVDEGPFAIVVLSPEGRVRSWGRAAEALLGWTAEQAIGRGLDELAVPDHAQDDWHTLLRDATEATVCGRVVLRRHRSGRLRLIEVSCRAFRAEDGSVRGFTAIKRDVTDEQVRRDIEIVADRYRGVLESMPDAIVVVNAIGSIVLFNEQATRLFGLAAMQALGQPVELLLPHEQRNVHVAHRGRFLRHPQRRTMGSGLELFGVRANGDRFPVEVSLSPLEISGHDYIVSAIRDLTDRKRYEDALRAAQAAERASAAKTEFLSRMSHELRTPLNAVLGFAQVLQLDARAPLAPQHAQQVHQIEQAGRHLLAMINDLLDVSRIEAGTLDLRLEPVSVDDVMDEVLALAGAMALEAGVTVERPIQPARVEVRADRVRLRQVLLNLLSNAVKYNRPGGSVVLSAERPGDQVALRVRDTGAGLSADQVAQLFQPFNRLGAERLGIEGTGIGLVISRRLVESMGGALDVASEPGVGTVFTLHLPVAKPAAAATDPAADRPG
jgi:PAS domain S-box-containing protein